MGPATALARSTYTPTPTHRARHPTARYPRAPATVPSPARYPDRRLVRLPVCSVTGACSVPSGCLRVASSPPTPILSSGSAASPFRPTHRARVHRPASGALRSSRAHRVSHTTSTSVVRHRTTPTTWPSRRPATSCSLTGTTPRRPVSPRTSSATSPWSSWMRACWPSVRATATSRRRASCRTR